MKKFEDLTQWELAQLSDEEVNQYLEVELMIQGIVVPEQPKEPLLDTVVKKTVVGYQVGGLIFAYKNDAEYVAKTAKWEEDYDYYGAGYDFKWLKISERDEIKEVMYYSEADIKAKTRELKAFKEAKSAYTTANKAYNEALKAVTSVQDEMYSKIYAARRHISEVDRARAVYEKYVALADGNHSIAANFFRQNFNEDMVREVLGETQEEAE